MAFIAVEFSGSGDPMFGGSAADWPLCKNGQFMASPRRDEVAECDRSWDAMSPLQLRFCLITAFAVTGVFAAVHLLISDIPRATLYVAIMVLLNQSIDRFKKAP